MPRTVDHEQRRAEIVLALWRFISRHGIDQVSLRKVAAEADVSVGRIQHYFGTRDALVLAGCEAMIVGAEARYEDETADSSPLKRLRFVLTHAIPQSESVRHGTTLWFSYLAASVNNPAIGTLLAETKRGTEEECARLIAALGVVEPVLAARRLLALTDGLTVRVLVGDLPATDAVDLLDAELAALAAAGPARRQ